MIDETTLTRIQTYVEELEKRIKTLSIQVTSTTQINSAKSCLEEIKTLLNEYITEYSAHLDEFDSKSQEFSDFKTNTNLSLHSIQNYNLSNTELVSDLSSRIATIESTLISLSSRMTTLENNPSGSGSSSDDSGGTSTSGCTCEPVLTFEDFFKTNINYPFGANNIVSPYISVLSDPYTYLQFDVSFGAELTQGNPAPINVSIYKNDTKFCTSQIAYNESGRYHFTQRLPIQSTLNNFYFEFQTAGRFMAKDMEVVVKSKNVVTIYHDDDLQFYCFNNYMYILKKTPQGLMWSIHSKSEFNMNNPNDFYLINNTSRQVVSPCCMVPLLKTTSPLETDTTVPSSLVVGYMNNVSSCQYFQIDKFTDTSCTELTNHYAVLTKGRFCDFLPYCQWGNSFILALTNYNNRVTILNQNRSVNSVIMLNNQKVEDCCDCVFVRNNNVTIGSVAPQFAGLVVTKTDGMNYYFPSYTNSYCLPIAKGRNPRAYIQTDGKINVYINRGTRSYKYVLTLNQQTMKYELESNITTYENALKCEEVFNKLYIKQLDSYRFE